MKLKGSQYRSLLETLLEAFPTAHALTSMVRIGLDLRMEVDIGGDNLREQVMNLLTWVEAHDKLPELLAAAREENPGNLGLKSLAEELLVPDQVVMSDGGVSDLDVALRVLREHERRGALGGLLARAFGAQGVATPPPPRVEPLLGTRSWVTIRSAGALASAASAANAARASPVLESTRSEKDSVRALAVEYDSVRARLPAGPQRTLLMERIAGSLRAASAEILPSLDTYMHDASAGARLAAVMALQESPRVEQLNWLSERVHAEKPFVGYHAALALREAAKELLPSARSTVQAAVVHALSAVGPPDAGTERAQVLQGALSILVERTTASG